MARRRWPIAALAGVAAVLCATSLVGVRFTPFVSNAGPALAIAVVAVASRRSRRTSLAGCAAAAVATSVAGLVGLWLHPEQDQDAVQLALVAVGWLVGDALRTRREYRQGLDLALLRQRAEQEQRVRAEERLRLSRDVHDIVSHTLSMITIRAGVARLLLPEGPDQTARATEAREALAVIETASRSALDELRRILRQTRTARSDETVAAPTLADLGTLVETARGQGLHVTFHVLDPERTAGTADAKGAEGAGAKGAGVKGAGVKGAGVKGAGVKGAGVKGAGVKGAGAETGEEPGRARYPLVLETSAYRIVQEALTNVARHAAAEHAQVEIDHRRGELVVSVVDDGRGYHPGAAPGIGLAGMRERAELFGGTLDAGPRPGGGFAVVVRFPVASREQ